MVEFKTPRFAMFFFILQLVSPETNADCQIYRIFLHLLHSSLVDASFPLPELLMKRSTAGKNALPPLMRKLRP
jgi:hypothetical protein